MKSVIHTSDVIANRSRRFGAATIYYPSRLVRADGSAVMLLFTERELTEATERARSNPEDFDAMREERRSWRAKRLRLAAVLGASGAIAIGTLIGLLVL